MTSMKTDKNTKDTQRSKQEAAGAKRNYMKNEIKKMKKMTTGKLSTKTSSS